MAMLCGSRISWFVMKEQPPGCPLAAGPTGHLHFMAEEKGNHHTHYSHVMFTVSNVDFELGRCKEGDCTEHGKSQTWEVMGWEGIGSLAEVHPGIICHRLSQSLYCHGKDWRRPVRRKKGRI